MKRKVFSRDIETLKAEGREIMESTADSRFYNRMAAVNAVLSGVSPRESGRVVRDDREGLVNLGEKADECGFDSLRDKLRPGAPRKLSDPDLIPIYQDEVHFQAQTTITSAWCKKGAPRK